MTPEIGKRPAARRAGTDLRVALFGYGLAGAVFHAPLIAATAGLELATVVTSNPERAERARREHAGVRVAGSADEVWMDAADHDVAVVATPNRTHAPLAAAALEAGLHVVVDKPLTATAEEGRQLNGSATSRGLVLTVFHNRRWDGDFLTVRRLIEEDALGEVYRFESRFERWRPAAREGTWRELGAPAEAGGVLFDLGSHLIDQALVLFGPVEGVYAEIERRRAGVEVDDDVFLALAHRSGVHSHLWASQAVAQPGPRMRVLGSQAAYVKHGLDVQEDALKAGMRPGDPRWGMEPRELWGALGAGDDVEPVATERGRYERFYEQLVPAVRDGAPPPVDAADAVAVIEIIEAASPR